MQDDARKFRVVLVMMRLPILREQINLDIARLRFVRAKLQNGPAKIRTGAVIPKAGMKHSHLLAIDGAEILAPETLVMPDTLQEAFGRMRGIAFAQERPCLLLRAPLCVKVRPESGHD
jgi:hypothetical protein